ncbi:MAG: MoaD/ThiS family protein [Pirellulales bacterium]
MIVRVRLFAAPRELVGRPEVTFELPEGSTIADLRVALAGEYPALAGVLPHCRFAAESDFAAESAGLVAGGEVACIPPVSGG